MQVSTQVKIAVGLAVAVVAVYAARRTATAAGDALWSVTPWNNNNVIYRGLNDYLWPDGSETLGTALYGVVDEYGPRVNPASPDNYIYSGINGAVWPDGSASLGTAAYDAVESVSNWFSNLFKPAPPGPQDWSTGLGRPGGANNPSAYVPPGYTGPGGAAFGIYPRAI